MCENTLGLETIGVAKSMMLVRRSLNLVTNSPLWKLGARIGIIVPLGLFNEKPWDDDSNFS